MKHAVICAEYIKERGGSRQNIYLVTRDENRKKCYLKIPIGKWGFRPYLYMLNWMYSKVSLFLKNNFRNYYLKIIRKNNPQFYKGGEVIKIETYYPNTIDILDRFLNKMGHWTIEADMSKKNRIAQRFLIDFGIKNGLEIDNKLTSIKPVNMDRDYRIFYIDIESLSGLGKVNPKSDEPIIVFGYYDSYTKQYVLLYHSAIIKEFNMKGVQLIKCKNEKDLLLKIVEIIDRDDPDIITAYNLFGYDIIKWVTRMARYNIKRGLLSKFDRTFPSERGRWKIWGRLLFDLLIGYKQLTAREIRRYDLEYIIEEESLPIKKIVFNKSFKQIWKEKPELILLRNYNDLKAMVLLEEKKNIIKFYDEISSLVGLRLDGCISRKKIIDTMLLRLFHDKYVFPTEKRRTIRPEEPSGYRKYLEGAKVIDSIPGVYTNTCLVDLKEMYPSIMLAFNISPDTLDQRLGQLVIDEEHKFLSPDEKEGIMRQMVSFFRELRNKKRKLKELAKTEEEYNRYQREERAIKFTENANYGVLDYDGFRLCKRQVARRIIKGKEETVNINRVAEAVTMMGRNIILKIIDKARSLGYNVIYGDTDSIFAQLDPNIKQDNLINNAMKLENVLNEYLREIEREYNLKGKYFTISLKSIYSDFWLGEAKKKYAGRIIWKNGKECDKIDIVGLEIIRSDASEIEREVMELVLLKLLTKVDVDSKIQYLINRVKNGEADPLEIAYPVGIRKVLSSYGKCKYKKKKGKIKIPVKPYMVGLPSQIKAIIYSNKYLGTEYGSGSKPMRLPIDSTKLSNYPKYINEEMEFPESIIKKGLPNYNIYVCNKIHGVLSKQEVTVGRNSNILCKKCYEKEKNRAIEKHGGMNALSMGKLDNAERRSRVRVLIDVPFKVTDIAIDPYTVIPKEFIQAIDWDDIYKRLMGKVNRITKVDNKKPEQSILINYDM